LRSYGLQRNVNVLFSLNSNLSFMFIRVIYELAFMPKAV
jgi:hypothetical protein